MLQIESAPSRRLQGCRDPRLSGLRAFSHPVALSVFYISFRARRKTHWGVYKTVSVYPSFQFRTNRTLWKATTLQSGRGPELGLCRRLNGWCSCFRQKPGLLLSNAFSRVAVVVPTGVRAIAAVVTASAVMVPRASLVGNLGDIVFSQSSLFHFLLPNSDSLLKTKARRRERQKH